MDTSVVVSGSLVKPQWKFRGLKQSDVSFLLDSWIKSHKKAKAFADLTPYQFHQKMQTVIARLVDESTLIVACDAQHDNLIYGYVCGLPPEMMKNPDGSFTQVRFPVVHYLFVRTDFRRFGLATDLLKQLGYIKGCGLIFTLPITSSGRDFQAAMGGGGEMIYNQFWFWGSKD